MKRPALSIVIPCYNDAAALEEQLAAIAGFPQRGELEVIVATASADPEAEAAESAAECHEATIVHVPMPGRGAQLRAGAEAARGEILLFQHADTELTSAHLQAILEGMAANPGCPGGAFYRDLHHQYPMFARLDRVIRPLARRFGILYGDQSCFVRRDRYEAMGGMAEMPLMEDVDFSDRLRREGEPLLLDPPIRTSMRKFNREGKLRRKLLNIAFLVAYRCGVSPERLYRWYDGRNP